ncbi:hypothetical protein [Paradevosia shaoguanensis]|uniref:Uncharacterized protein n=1 Tax=Paradevosia shaoguanensis TaxID=1335043 RepID=A0AA41QNI2_9HYPH|nr:hypothetical protein [Paradevosia shaoguanensis]MCF1742258.1 hypothetical protein [Paradevosia shaoguanensis]MCI0126741.1 hypothetical protein [Paradevosia shaoguanensis]
MASSRDCGPSLDTIPPERSTLTYPPTPQPDYNPDTTLTATRQEQKPASNIPQKLANFRSKPAKDAQTNPEIESKFNDLRAPRKTKLNNINMLTSKPNAKLQ